MKRSIFASLLAIGLASAAFADCADDCQQSDDVDLKIGACTKMIRSGELNNEWLSWAFNARGDGYYKAGEHQKALDDFDTAISRNPDNQDAFYNRGVANNALGNSYAAISDYDQALRMKPEDHDARNNRAWVSCRVGLTQDAMNDWDKILPGDPSRTRGWQEDFREMGTYAGAVDGKYGPGTRRALLEYAGRKCPQ